MKTYKIINDLDECNKLAKKGWRAINLSLGYGSWGILMEKDSN